MPERTDQEWIRLLKQDDPQAVLDLWALLLSFGHALDPDDPGRDAAVQAYWRVRTRGLTQFRFECSFRGYCRRIVTNEVRRRYKKQPPLVELDDDLVGKPDPDPPIDIARLRARLQPCLDQLASRERDIVNLRYSQEQDPEQIATRLGIARGNVIAHRARSKLRRCLQGRGYRTADEVAS